MSALGMKIIVDMMIINNSKETKKIGVFMCLLPESDKSAQLNLSIIYKHCGFIKVLFIQEKEKKIIIHFP